MLLYLLSDKNNNGKNKYSITTQISLTESLMWKIRGRNFPILLDVMKVFEEIKTSNTKNSNNILFVLDHDNYFNINNINERKIIEIKFKVFKILVSQILNKINNIIIQEKEKKILLERNPSNIADFHYKKIFENIMSYFYEINPECHYYYDIILFFYKNLINSKILFSFILSKYPIVIDKIMKIIFDYEKEDNKYDDKRKKFTKIIMIKLFGQIIESIEEHEIIDFSEFLTYFEKVNLENKNPFIYLYEKILNELNNTIKNKSLYKYFNELLLLCLNKIIKIEKNEDVVKKLVKNNLSNIILLLFSDKSSDISDNEFMTKTSYKKNFKNEALFNSEDNEFNKNGRTICFLKYGYDKTKDTYFYNNIRNYIQNYLNNNLILYFDKTILDYNIKNNNNKSNDVLIIMDDTKQSEFYKIESIQIKSFKDITVIKNDNKYQKQFIENYSLLIANIIKDEIKNDALNEKGIFFLLKIISKLIRYLNKENIIILFKYIWNYYEKNNKMENNYAFMSIEFLENIMDKYLDCYNSCYKNIYKEPENNKSLYNLFNYIIENKSLGVYFKLNNKINWFKDCLIIPIIEINFDNNMKNIYNTSKKLGSLSFYNCHNIYRNEIINEDSILFTKSISDYNHLQNLS